MCKHWCKISALQKQPTADKCASPDNKTSAWLNNEQLTNVQASAQG